MGEMILAVKAELVTSMNIPNGIAQFPTQSMLDIINTFGENYVVMDRDLLEGNPDYRQIIPYVILQHNDTYFSAVRTPKGGDKRLHNKRIVGFGGHANLIPDPPMSFMNQVKLNAQRELEEELIIKDNFSLKFNGIINDLSTPVSKDHIGIYIVAELSSPLVYINETSVLVDSGLFTKEALYEYYEDLENWSKLVYTVI